jgi:hypothetical protein
MNAYFGRNGRVFSAETRPPGGFFPARIVPSRPEVGFHLRQTDFMGDVL